ncbi:MAG: hypothetical protein JW712_13475 [Dehalococcoidales bacterium]|nr:hypothetical protein [Dehalococcoidales bacterium]
MIAQRSDDNPVLEPKRNHLWESVAVFNGCPVRMGEDIYLAYRALSLPYYNVLSDTTHSVSSIGLAKSEDGIHFFRRRRFIFPEYPWERFGCEDPRVTKLGDTYYFFYTALSTWPPTPDGIKVGVALSKDLKKVTEKHLVTPFNAKAMALFPEKIGGRIYAILTVNTDRPPVRVCIAVFDREEDIWSQAYWHEWYKHIEQYELPLRVSHDDHYEVGAPPVKTKDGWLLLYSYIKDYFSGTREKLFEVQSVLLDPDDPLEISGRTDMPILIPEEYYEKYGMVPNVVFPSGGLADDDHYYLYYGAADTTCCTASVRLPALLGVLQNKEPILKLQRAEENPVISPVREHLWESKATFNPAALHLDGKVHILYRAMSGDNTSTLGYAESSDGIHIDYRSTEPVYVPRESFETKLVPGGNSGCEDPRLTRIGDRIFLFYTAYNGKNPPRVAVSTITVTDFLNRNWKWSDPNLITPPQYDNKDAFLFPEPVDGKYICVHRLGNDIDYDFCPDVDERFKGTVWLNEHRWIEPRVAWWDSKKVGAAAPPVKTDKGWIMLYHGVSDDSVYRVGALLLDLDDPIKILARTIYPIFEPETPYEINGQVSRVVFPCGNVILGDTLFVYYGGGDSVTGVATVKVKDLLRILRLSRF